MSDERLRRLERRWKATGSAAAEAAYRRALLRGDPEGAARYQALEACWGTYLQAVQEQVRFERQAAQQRLLEAAAALDEPARDAWARAVARRIVDGGEELPLRLPLFGQVVLPALLRGLRRSEPGCARWLAGFDTLLFARHSLRPQLPTDVRDAPSMLRLALEHDPGDSLARQRLIELLADRLSAALADLPDDLVLVANSTLASLTSEVDELRRLTEAEGVADRYQTLLAECAVHLPACARYQATDRSQTYQAFLAAEGLQPPEAV